jgi:caffeoyl-CoA O-methyltransferase
MQPAMKLFVPDAIESYAHDHTRPRPQLFDELASFTKANVPWPQMQVGRVEGSLLKLLAALAGARRILEIGTYTGYSAMCLAEALPEGGELVTCEIDQAIADIARSFVDCSPHAAKIRIAVGDGLETVRGLAGPFDMAFIDADKARYLDYYEAILPILRPGGLIAADNVLWSGEVLDPNSEDGVGLARFNDHVTGDPRVENVFLTVRDGLMLIRKL